ncbi:MAG: hypothetical protein ABSD29_05860, partial [Verrucomicrobiota bacterium]
SPVGAAYSGNHLRAGVCHEPKMPLLTELENLFLSWFYKDFTPAALSGTSPIPENIAGRNVPIVRPNGANTRLRTGVE